MLKLYNTLTKQKDVFKPIEPGKVKMYVCGMTVYDLCHVGHARVMVVFDVVTRYLRASGYDVTYIRNITDIDDKIIKRAMENGESIQTLTDRYIDEMHADADALGVLRPDLEPRATEAVDAMQKMVQTLIDKGLAYVADNGDVYYDVSEFEGYGKLSGRHIDDLRAGERVAVNEAKTDPLDFVLWKAAKPEEPSWESPWGPGRPGWHIECSAMSADTLGHHFDIHGGGQDLQFPHHENEIAQSEGAHGCQYVNYWMHNGFVRIDDEKMSKSLGNFFTVREVLAKYPAEAVRYFILMSHYRSPLNYAEDQLDQAKTALTRFYHSLRDVTPQKVIWREDAEFASRFAEAMDDDFNTALALSVLADVRQALNKAREESDEQKSAYLAGLLLAFGEVLGLFQQSAEAFLTGGQQDETGKIEQLIADRNAARAAKDWGRADQVRDELTAMGIVLEDAAGKTSWRKI
ncbi:MULTISPECIES: cysteine--tRNA ligase [unclassified Methylophaga]|jgi:cysteinyl-tRNA synthetase|uniref:cysteine--tRNA ligase n=1 Tax=unclassified Methylophaga TaxID=2629249 RepID=UPI000C89C0D3|nr:MULTISPECIES: cysteine--tRNA ligase [unclassified Methylophaga]MAK66996.1 cysteine--tRNA ligase [Methylophaga sp.]MAY18033.1 cysteine--tRNA ligase [Methylophaga sp.]|tara:strand:+ start:5679 stop:7061 length:1383 start_codon:yes stop_codon:yes gene_type:complete